MAGDRRRRGASTSSRELAELAADNVDLNFDAVFKLALRDEEAAGPRRGAARPLRVRSARPDPGAGGRCCANDPDAEVRREAAIALGRYALAAELGYLRDERRRRGARGADRERRGPGGGRARARPRHRGAGRDQRRGDRQPDREHLRRGQPLAQGRRRGRDGAQLQRDLAADRPARDGEPGAGDAPRGRFRRGRDRRRGAPSSR